MITSCAASHTRRGRLTSMLDRLAEKYHGELEPEVDRVSMDVDQGMDPGTPPPQGTQGHQLDPVAV